MTKEEGHLLWPFAYGIRCLNNNKASLTWRLIRSSLWVGKKLFSACLSISSECIRCGDREESISHAFFHSPVVPALSKFLEGYTVREMKGKFFILEASSVYSNVILSLNRSEHYVFAYSALCE